jgi:hypothetical protein
MNEAQRKNMMRLFRDREMDNRDTRLAYTTMVVGRTLTTSSDLNETEADQIIAHLEQYDLNDPSTWPIPDA